MQMNGRKRVWQVVAGVMGIVIIAQVTTSCGTLLYPERRGQNGGDIDPVVVLLDGMGCLLFILPGLVAFIVDFSTGAIYLPRWRLGSSDASPNSNGMVKINVDSRMLNRKDIERIVNNELQIQLKLNSPEVQVQRVTTREDLVMAQAKIRSFAVQSQQE